jgi:hypothetical protein
MFYYFNSLAIFELKMSEQHKLKKKRKKEPCASQMPKRNGYTFYTLLAAFILLGMACSTVVFECGAGLGLCLPGSLWARAQ